MGRYAIADQENAPLIALDQGLISGNSQDTQQALAPAIANIAGAKNATTQQIMDTTAPGAARDSALQGQNLSTGQQVASLTNNTWLNAFQTLSNIAGQQFGVAGQQLGAGITSQGQGITAASNLAQNQTEGKEATLGFLGQLAGAGGMVASAGIKNCWIAEAIYGFDDDRTHRVRAWLNGPFEDTWYGHAVMELYGLIGRQVAWVARRSALLRMSLKPLFDMALRRSIAWRA